MPGHHVSVYLIHFRDAAGRGIYRYIVSTPTHCVPDMDVYDQPEPLPPFPVHRAVWLGSFRDVYPQVAARYEEPVVRELPPLADNPFVDAATMPWIPSRTLPSATRRWGFGDYVDILIMLFPQLIQYHFFENYAGGVDCYWRNSTAPAAHYARLNCIGAFSPNHWFCTERFVYQATVIFRDWDHARSKI